MNSAANDKGRVKVFIIGTEYAYAATPSPVVVPKRGATLDFENLSNDTATITIPGRQPLLLKPGGSGSVPLPDCTDKATDRVIRYEVAMGGGLLARGNSAPIIIRDP